MPLDKIKALVNDLRNRKPTYTDDEAFLHWFLEAYLLFGESDDTIKQCIIGGTGDKNIDAFYKDDKSNRLFLFQTKFRQAQTVAEKQNDVKQFFWTCKKIQQSYDDFRITVKNSEVRKAVNAMKKPLDAGYSMVGVYVTTGKISEEIKKDVRDEFKDIQTILCDNSVIEGLYHDYLDGVAPPVPYIRLRAAQGSIIKLEHPNDKNVKTFHFFTFAKDVRKAFVESDIKLFARNIRGYLGENGINKGIIETLRSESDNFHFFNNGITIIADKAEFYAGAAEFTLENPQIINGQQTTRCIADSDCDDALVSVRAIAIPKSSDKFQNIVKSIVARTNYQNAIKASDLASNDPVQVWLEKEFRKRKYRYIRKRMIRSEENKLYTQIYDWRIERNVLAQAVAAIEIGPKEVREGIENLYEKERTYKKIFKQDAPIEYFLIPFWIHTVVKERSSQARSYAIWYALNHFYFRLDKELGKGNGWRKFIQICERKRLHEERNIYSNFVNLSECIFLLLIDGFFASHEKAKKRNGVEIERSSFFKTEKAVTEFRKYLRSHSSAKYRNKIDKSITQIAKKVKGYDVQNV